MHTKDIFELKDGVKFDLGKNAHIIRVSNIKTGSFVQLLMEEKLDKNLGKFIKPSAFSKLSYTTRNSKREKTTIVSFNIPEQSIAYKAIFYGLGNNPIKVFSSIEEGRWSVVSNPSQKIIDNCLYEKNKLEGSIFPRKCEGPVTFSR